MKNLVPILILIIVTLSVSLFYFSQKTPKDNLQPTVKEELSLEDEVNQKEDEESNETGLANPASVFCENNKGKLEIVKDSTNGEFGICVLADGKKCEEWAYYRGECDFENDTKLIKQALLDKGLNLSMSKVVINKHFGKYIAGSVVPIDENVGGGYVYAYKENGKITIVADGNGAITCKQLEDFEDYPNYLIPVCYDEVSGKEVER